MLTKDFTLWAIFLFTQVLRSSSTCLRSIPCPCGTKEDLVYYTQCVNTTLDEKSACERWANCETCEANSTKCLTCPPGRSGPSCYEEVLTCPDPGIPEGGSRQDAAENEVVEEQLFIEGESLYFYCNDEDSKLIGDSPITCLANGWSSPLPFCEKTLIGATEKSAICPDPGIPEGGRRQNAAGNEIVEQQGFEEGESLYFYCNDEDSELKGDSHITCLSDGWSAPLPRCEKPDPDANCTDPGLIQYGYHRLVNGNQSRSQTFSHGQSFRYFCNRGYELKGKHQLTCLPGGKWSSSPPWCSKEGSPDMIPCRYPEPNPNSRLAAPIQKYPIWSPNTLLTYTCDEGFETSDPLMIFCMKSGQWTSPPPICKKIGVTGTICTTPGAIKHGKIIVYHNNQNASRRPSKDGLSDLEYAVGTRLRYECDSGYTLEGETDLVCQPTGKWSSTRPSCIQEVCTYPGSIEHGRVETTTNPSVSRRQGRQRSFGYPVGTRLRYECSYGYILEGEPNLTCQTNGKWSIDKPSCIEAVCIGPGPIKHGKVVVYNNNPTEIGQSSRGNMSSFEYPFGSRLRYACKPGYVLEGEMEIICTHTGKWSMDKPKCSEGVKSLNLQIEDLIPDCGRAGFQEGVKITESRILQPGEFPFVVQIATYGSPMFTGILLDQRTILTVAHHFDKAERCTLYFGKYNRSDSNDDKYVEYRLSSQIIKHPEYDEQTYDNDIAIVKFSPDISYSARIQAVCMPGADSTSTVKKGIGYLLGWSPNKKYLQSPNLMVSPLEIQAKKTCVAAFKKRNQPLKFTERMFCGVNTDKPMNVSVGGSGAPIVFNRYATDRFTLEGIESHRTLESCNEQKSYIIFVRASSYKEWIMQSMQ